MRRHRFLLVSAILSLSSAAVSPASAGTLTWSGPASPCGSTLQGCINGAGSGDIVEVATNVPIHEDLTIDKSLELAAAPGFSPVLGDLRTVLLTNPALQANRIRFRDFTLTRGFVSAVQVSGKTFDVEVRNLTIHNTFNGRAEIEVRPGSFGPYGPVQAGIVGNRLTIPANSQALGARAISLEGGSAASLLGLIQGNRIDHFDGGQEGAIGVFNLTADLDVTVVANEVRGSDYNDGVLFFQFGEGSSNVRVLDNLVVGQTTKSGVPVSYALVVDAGDATFEIVNNTAADGDNGIFVLGRDDLGASWSGIVANNVVSGMSGTGIVLAQPTLTSGVVDNDHNLVFDVGNNLFTPGPGTLFADPLFLVDMGAYESPSLVASGHAPSGASRLHSNTPNPFHSTTSIRYELTRRERVRLGVFDVRGRLVRWLVSGAVLEPGPQGSDWDGRGIRGEPMPPGVYFCRLEAGGTSTMRRMVLLP
jgi:hypothetical protein